MGNNILVGDQVYIIFSSNGGLVKNDRVEGVVNLQFDRFFRVHGSDDVEYDCEFLLEGKSLGWASLGFMNFGKVYKSVEH